MSNSRLTKVKLNIIFSLLSQGVTLICGLIVPGIMIGAFGSEIYGATASIAQFLGFITLLEGGIGGLARSALYKPLAEGDMEKISAITSEVRHFFKVLGLVFSGYVLILSIGYKYISGFEALDWISTAMLVIVISISTFGQYFIGASYGMLLSANQKSYIVSILGITTTIINACLVVILVSNNCDIIIVKLVSSLIFFIRPVVLAIIVKKTFKLEKSTSNTRYLDQKGTALGQHLAFFLHSNTDVTILTLFANLVLVSVYSVYNMVISHIQSFTGSFTAGMEAVLGELHAKNERDELNKTFNRYETLISIVSLILFSTTAVLIVPFIKIYTANFTDADYIQPLFSLLLTISSLLHCLRMPYHAITIAAGKFKETKWAAYGEAIVNILVSIILVSNLGLVGVAIGTIAATLFRFLFYVYYLSKEVLFRSAWIFLKRQITNIVTFIAVYLLSSFAISYFDISNYGTWAICGFITVAIAAIITITTNIIFHRKETVSVFKSFLNK